MKILVATGLYAPEIGGPATHTAMMEAELPALGFEVKVLAFREVRHLPKLIRHIAYAYKVWREARRVDVVFAQDTLSVGLPAFTGVKLAGARFVVRVPGDYVWEQATQRFGVKESIDAFQAKRYAWRVELLRRLQQWTVRSADLVITPSEYFKQLVTHWGVPPERIKTIYNGINFDVEPVAPTEMPPHPFMVTAGRLVPWKGIDRLIELVSDLKDWNLVIVGDGPERDRLESIRENLGVSDRVYFTGTKTRAETLGWCAAADAFVLNSSFESFSYQVVEALSSGTPVITTNIGSLPEIVRDGIDGALVSPDDLEAIKGAIESTQPDASTWASRCESAKARAREFSAERTASNLAHALRELNH